MRGHSSSLPAIPQVTSSVRLTHPASAPCRATGRQRRRTPEARRSAPCSASGIASPYQTQIGQKAPPVSAHSAVTANPAKPDTAACIARARLRRMS